MKRIFTFYFLVCPFISTGQIVNVEDLRTTFKDSIGWYERIDLNASLLKNTEQIFAGSGAIQLEFLHLNRRFLSISEYRFLKAGSNEFINEGMQHLRYNIKLSKYYTHEFFTQLQYNQQTAIKIRALIGTGIRIPLLGNEQYKVHYGLAYMFEYNEENEARNVFRDHRMSTYLSLNIKLLGHLKFVSTTYYQPIITNLDSFRLSSQNTFEINLSKIFSFTIKYTANYNKRIREGTPLFTYHLTNGLRLKL